MKCKNGFIAVVGCVLTLSVVQVATGQDSKSKPQDVKAAEVSKPGTLPKFLLSDLEKSKLETLQARRNTLNAQVRAVQAELQIQLQTLQVDIARYASDTIKAHGVDNVVLTPETLEWVTVKKEEPSK